MRGRVTDFFMPFTQPHNSQSGFNTLQLILLAFCGFIIAIVVLAAYVNARATARDAKRVSDIQQIQLALKYFHEEFGYYPQSSPSYQAVGVDNSFSRFLSPWPTAPSPVDGSCTENTNNYVYEQVGGGDSYSIKFCLGDDYRSLPAGIRIATPDNYQ